MSRTTRACMKASSTSLPPSRRSSIWRPWSTSGGQRSDCSVKGGSLIISVPNRQRLNRARLEVFDVPPHHVSRWSPQQLRKFARRIGMETGWVRIEPGGNLTLGALYFPVVEHYLVARMGRSR